MPTPPLTQAERDRFDELLEEAIEALPDEFRELIEQVPVIVEDRPDREVLEEFRDEEGHLPEPDELCGLHTGIPFTERHLEGDPELPSEIMLYRLGIIAAAGGWEQADADDVVYEEIMITLLHEMGHQFGLDEEDLRRLGYE
ncbi:MAG: metallopeptidase family protein [Phycisphaerae bacterium]|jgi:predicted Zn-dependent protease with MMP-like domain